MPIFGPLGASSTVNVTSTSQTFALPTLPSFADRTTAIRLVGRQANQVAWYIKFGTGATTVSRTDGKRVDVGSIDFPLILGVPSGATHVAILCEGPPGDVTITSGSLLAKNPEDFAPLGASQIVAVTQIDQRIALPPTGSFGSIQLVGMQANMVSLFLKFGDNIVVGDRDTSMQVRPGSIAAPAVFDILASTHLSIFCEGSPGGVILTPGGFAQSANEAQAVTAAAVIADNAIVRGDGGGRGIQGSGVTLDDNKNVSSLGYVDFDEIASPANPAANDARLYGVDESTVTRMAYKDTGGNETFLREMWRPVATGTVSGVANLDISIPTWADGLEIDLVNWRPATDADIFYMRFSQGGSFLSGASDYEWVYQLEGANITNAADSEMHLTAPCGNAAGEHLTYKVRIFKPSEPSFVKTALFEGFETNISGIMFPINGGGSLVLNTNAIDGVRFLFSTGNIAEGFYGARAFRYS